jgi:hypothetical protein
MGCFAETAAAKNGRAPIAERAAAGSANRPYRFILAFAATTAAIRSMRVTMLQFIRLGSADFMDRYGKVKVLASERVVTVDRHIITVNGDDPNRYRSLIGAGLKLHSRGQIFDPLKTLFRNNLSEVGIGFAIGIGWLYPHCRAVASLFALNPCLQARDNIAMAVKIDQWLPRLGLIDDISFIIFEFIIHRNNGTFGNLHNL